MIRVVVISIALVVSNVAYAQNSTPIPNYDPSFENTYPYTPMCLEGKQIGNSYFCITPLEKVYNVCKRHQVNVVTCNTALLSYPSRCPTAYQWSECYAIDQKWQTSSEYKKQEQAQEDYDTKQDQLDHNLVQKFDVNKE